MFTSGAGDLTSGTVTLTFDRPVKPGGPDHSLIPMYLVIYGSGSSCSAPNGNGHSYLAGAGTSTITIGEVTSMTAGTTYITIASGLVTATAGGAPNLAQPCTAIPVSGSPPPPPPPTTSGPGAPTFSSGAGDLTANTVTLTFDRPVKPGGPDHSLIPMYLVIYGKDATCAMPNGNAHSYLAGAGTSTITMGEVTSLTAGTTYITIAPGLVTAVAGDVSNRALLCTPIPVSG